MNPKVKHFWNLIAKGGQFTKGKQLISSDFSWLQRRYYQITEKSDGIENDKTSETDGKKNSKTKKSSKYGSGRYFGVSYNNKNSGMNVRGEILFGIHPVSIALAQRRRRFHKLYIKEKQFSAEFKDLLALASISDIPKEQVSKRVLDQLAEGRPHQGVCLDTNALDVPDLKLEDIREVMKEPSSIWVLPYQVVDTMNMGAIIRSSYFLGVDRVVLLNKHSATASPMVSKASSGTMEVMSLAVCKNVTTLQDFLQMWKENGGEVIGTASSHVNTVAVQNHVVTKPTMVIVGNEKHGVRDEVLDICDTVITVEGSSDLLPAVDSLNVSVATGIILHALKTNRRTPGK